MSHLTSTDIFSPSLFFYMSLFVLVPVTIIVKNEIVDNKKNYLYYIFVIPITFIVTLFFILFALAFYNFLGYYIFPFISDSF